MKVYFIIEEVFSDNVYDWSMVGAVSTEEEAAKIVNYLMESVKEYNNRNSGSKVNYCYDYEEVGDLSYVNAYLKYNREKRKG